FNRWSRAAAARLAIVSTEVVGASAELVRDRLNGRLFPAGNLAALTTCQLDVTDSSRIDTMKSASFVILADWRNRGDPVHGLRQALSTCGLIEHSEVKEQPADLRR